VALDKQLEASLREAVEAQGQPESVARFLIAWMDNASSSELKSSEQDDHWNNVMDAIQIDADN
jgi:hypothetical protein